MWVNPILYHREKNSMEKNIEKRQLLTKSVKKSFLKVTLTINNVTR